MLSTVGDIMMHVGDILSTVGGCTVPWGMYSTVGDIMINVEVILSTVGDIMMHMGGYHEYHGGYHPLTVEGVQYGGSTQITKAPPPPHSAVTFPRYS